MVRLHTPSPPCTEHLRGSPLALYGEAGDTCHAEGCGARLRRSNRWDTCERCQRKGHTPLARKRAQRESCDRPVDDAPSFMAPARLPSREELELAGDKRRKNGETKARVLEYLRQSGDWCRCKEVADALGVVNGSASLHLKNLLEAGVIEQKRTDDFGGMWLYRVRLPEPAYTAQDGLLADENGDSAAEVACDCADPKSRTADDAAPVPDPESAGQGIDVAPSSSAASADLPEPKASLNDVAPVTQGQHPADEAAAPELTPQESPPAAGAEEPPDDERYDVPLRPFAGVMLAESWGRSRELRILDDMEQLRPAERERVMQYAVDRWWVEPERQAMADELAHRLAARLAEVGA